MDYVESLGLPLIANRLRRLSDSLVDWIAQSLRELDLKVPPRSASTVLLLADVGPLGPVEIARRLHFSHPLIIRSLKLLADLGLVESIVDTSDQRRSLVRLTAAGQVEAATLRRFNQRLDARLRDIAAAVQVDPDRLLEEIGRLTAVFHPTLSTLTPSKD